MVLSPTRRRLGKVGLVIGATAVAVGVLIAHRTPATGYELSVYHATPVAVWACLAVALATAILVGLTAGAADDRGVLAGALVVGGAAMTVFIGLPIVRGYRYYGHHDALTHLGWARAISTGTMSPFDLFYPGIHTAGGFVSGVVGIPLSRAMLFVVLGSALVYLVFVPLCVRLVAPTGMATAIAAFGAFLLLPITSISTYLLPHAMSQAIFVSTVFLFLLLKYVTTSSRGISISAVGAMLALVSACTLLYHPQLVAHLIAVAVGICLVQYAYRRRASSGPVDSWSSRTRISDHETLYGQTLFLIVLFFGWSSNHGFFLGTVSAAVGGTLEFLFGGAGTAGAAVASQSGSLQEVGGSLPELFLKLFAVKAIVALAAGALIVDILLRGSEGRFRDIPSVTKYVTVGLIGLSTVFGLYFLSSASKLYFRVVGLVMVLVVVLAAIAVYEGVSRVRWSSSISIQAGLSVILGVLVVASLITVFPSPYVYKASPHVTDMQIEGYEQTFAVRNTSKGLAGFRNAPNRYDDAVNGNEDLKRSHYTITEDDMAEPLTRRFETDTYVVVSQATIEREQRAYRGLRFTRPEIRGIGTQRRVDRVVANDQFDLYLVPASR
ncbi:hypothetical protein BV210_19200 (plasmid) [Halorientalis sp. IM1011]|uniref:hypothetical protein n=1 Tax=Halorientalis sp. IM1011 TaxID=1932360 RepID=UPI00097CCB9A|nr:hypothetical protein [Halorientalis sp. IM1011]AQL44888.1 hypothetical protein BV210_19200 [Halorientalis sp. IM1011]